MNKQPNVYIEALRHALTALGVFLATNGYIATEDWQIYSGVILSIAPSIWGLVETRRTKKLLAAQQTVAIAKEIAKSDVNNLAEATETVKREVQEVLKYTK